MHSVEQSAQRITALLEDLMERLPLMQHDVRTLADRVDALSQRLDAHIDSSAHQQEHHCKSCRCDRRGGGGGRWRRHKEHHRSLPERV